MQSSESRGFAQFGGFLLLVSLVLPYFAISIAGLGGYGFRLWTVDKGAFVMVAAYGLIALSQVTFADRQTQSVIFLIIGALFTAALVYKIWISPPGSAPIGDTLGGKIPGGSDVSARDVLKELGIDLKASYGAFVAIIGSLFFTAGAFLEWRSAGSAPAGPVYVQNPQPGMPPEQQPGMGFYGPATPQASPQQIYAPPAQAMPPDPFAPPLAAPRQAAPAAQVPPGYVPPRPPGS